MTASRTDFASVLGEHIAVASALAGDPSLIASIEDAAHLTERAISGGNKLLLCGNGGSAADCQHIAAELVGKFYFHRRSLPAEALTTNTSALTAIGNDYSYEEVFSRQLEGVGRSGDVLLGISTSGHSKNVLQAFATAKSMGIATIMLTGSALEGAAVPHCDLLISVPSKVTPRIQEAHILIGHYICEHVEREICGKP